MQEKKIRQSNHLNLLSAKKTGRVCSERTHGASTGISATNHFVFYMLRSVSSIDFASFFTFPLDLSAFSASRRSCECSMEGPSRAKLCTPNRHPWRHPGSKTKKSTDAPVGEQNKRRNRVPASREFLLGYRVLAKIQQQAFTCWG